MLAATAFARDCTPHGHAASRHAGCGTSSDAHQVRRFARDPSFALGEIRRAAAVPTRAIVADDAIALLPIDAADPGREACVVRTPTLATAVSAVIRRVYETAQPLTDPDHHDEEPDVARGRRALLDLLAHGHTAKSIVERLTVHPRTIARDIDQMCHKYGVAGQSALGIAVADRVRLPNRHEDPGRDDRPARDIARTAPRDE